MKNTENTKNTIAIDLSPLQGPHRMRGIGQTLLNVLINFDDEFRLNTKLVLFVDPNNDQEVECIEILKLRGFSYEVRHLKLKRRFSLRLPGKLKYINSILQQLCDILDFLTGSNRTGSLRGIDFFIQIDQSTSLPRSFSTVKKVLMIHDLIPYVLEWDYLWNYSTAKQRGYSWKGALICAARRATYRFKIMCNAIRADIILSNSEATKKDFINYLNINESKIKVTTLGSDVVVESKVNSKYIDCAKYIKSSWGYLPKTIRINSDDKFLLYVGGVDPRKKIQELVAAFNMLQARGEDVKLVLLGDSMMGVDNIANIEVKQALSKSSYLDNVIFLGFAEEAVKEWLFKNALAFIFTSRYEGFGLPVIEAMRYGTPIIAYKNEATFEVASDLIIYAKNSVEIVKEVNKLLEYGYKRVDRDKLIKHSKAFDWTETSKKISALLK